MNNVLVPCFRRPEFLSYCIQHIQQANGSDRYNYVFALDYGYDPANLEVLKAFGLRHEFIYTPRITHQTTKQSYSLLNALVYCSKGADLVFLVEDDVMIGRDFFQWHEELHRHELFSSHANLNVNSQQVEGHWDEYYLTTGDYGSIGTCLTSKSIHDKIGPHFNPMYLRDPVKYVSQTFPDSMLKKDQVEQDGLIRRIQMQQDLPMAYPCHRYIDGLLYGPRCYHAGFVGKNRPVRSLAGSMDEKTRQVGGIIYNTEGMRLMCGPYWYDSIPCALELPTWNHLKRIGSPKCPL